MIRRREAWMIRRLLVGLPLDGELRSVSEPFRGVADLLATLPLEARQTAWEAFLTGQEDRDRIILDLAQVDPGGPPPEADADDGEVADDWEPLRLGGLPPVEAFPVDVLPPPAAEFVQAVSEAIGCPPDFVGLPALIVAGAAVGRSVSLMLKPGYFAPASLYGMNIGGPSSGKSPALDFAVRPLWEIDQRLHDAYRVAREKYDRDMEAYEKTKRSDRPPKPIKPLIESAVLDDVTVEAVARHLVINPRGLLISRDEGSAWVASIGQYKNGRGSDRQFYLSALFGKPVRVDRKGNPDLEPYRIPHPFLSVIGNLPPEMLGELREQRGRADGFVERILFAYPDPRPRLHWSDTGVPDEAGDAWAEIVERLRARPMAVSPEGKPQSRVIAMTREAKSRWVAWYNAHVDETNEPGYDASNLAAEGKLCDFAARLALILHTLDLACDPTRRDAEELPPVSGWAVEGATRLWTYFRSHHRRVRWSMDGGVGNANARAILDWVKRTGRASFTVAEVKDDLRWLADRPNEPESALSWLEQRGAIRECPASERPVGKRGRTPSTRYEVHPDLRAR